VREMHGLLGRHLREAGASAESVRLWTETPACADGQWARDY